MTVRIMLATNDHRNGEPTGHVRALQILDVITLDAPEPPPTCRILTDRRPPYVEIDGTLYPIQDYASWVGNWCWDAVTVSDDDAVTILDRLRKTECWSIDEAEHTVFGKWERGEKILSSDLRDDDE
jgi:hypothetical protein